VQLGQKKQLREACFLPGFRKMFLNECPHKTYVISIEAAQTHVISTEGVQLYRTP